MATVTIGGQEYTTGPLKFKQLKKLWPVILENQKLAKEAKDGGRQLDPIESMGNAIKIVAAALERTNPELTAEKIEDEIDANECVALQTVILDILEESGFQLKVGEAPAVEGAAASPSTETSTD
jgi:hypothetical protein